MTAGTANLQSFVLLKDSPEKNSASPLSLIGGTRVNHPDIPFPCPSLQPSPQPSCPQPCHRPSDTCLWPITRSGRNQEHDNSM
ncbi:hypothetical protein AOLI_G00059560 [Acnodon oligacanthus]